MRNIAGLVAGQDAREDESRDPRLLRGFDEVPIPEVFHFFQRVALSAARVSRCAGDDSIRAAHGSLQRRRVEHVPSRDFHPFAARWLGSVPSRTSARTRFPRSKSASTTRPPRSPVAPKTRTVLVSDMRLATCYG